MTWYEGVLRVHKKIRVWRSATSAARVFLIPCKVFSVAGSCASSCAAGRGVVSSL